jgi:hypothetical protein
MPWRSGFSVGWVGLFQRYDDFPSEWDQLQASVPLNFVLHLCIILSILSYCLQLFTLLLTICLLLILHKPLFNILSHANSLQLNPFYIFFTLVSSPRYLPPYPFVIRAFRSTQAHSSYTHTHSLSLNQC